MNPVFLNKPDPGQASSKKHSPGSGPAEGLSQSGGFAAQGLIMASFRQKMNAIDLITSKSTF